MTDLPDPTSSPSQPPEHHLPDELLLAYATGTASAPIALLVASHLTLCPACREKAATYEAVGGALLAEAAIDTRGAVDGGEPTLDDGALDALLARLDAPREPEPEPVYDPDGVLPAPLVRRVGAFRDLRWRWLAPDTHGVKVMDRPGHLPVRLVRIRPGAVLPPHDHTGVERALILGGGWSDEVGHFERGDVAYVEADRTDHRQVILDAVPCVALVVNDAPLRCHNPLMRLVTRVLGV